MALAPAHRFGQIIGGMLESTVRPLMQAVADEHNLYLDTKGTRPIRGKKRKVTWEDAFGNQNDLDFVLETDGTANRIGTPRAFIEVAWRRYTKHSRNKAREIQCSISPLAERYYDCHPFLGVVLAGVFTEGSLAQLRSNKFQVLYFPYESIIAAFAAVGIDAHFDEKTPDSALTRKIKKYIALSDRKKESISIALRAPL